MPGGQLQERAPQASPHLRVTLAVGADQAWGSSVSGWGQRKREVGARKGQVRRASHGQGLAGPHPPDSVASQQVCFLLTEQLGHRGGASVGQARLKTDLLHLHGVRRNWRREPS